MLSSNIEQQRSTHTARLPNFIILGACKSGTSGLYRDLARHPNAFLPSKKEPNILNTAKSSDDACRRYTCHFAGAPANSIVGEASTYYTMVPEITGSARLASRLLPEQVRFVYIMRDPIKRIESQLAFEYAIGRLRHTDFDRAVREDPKYVHWSDYPRQLKPWFDHFHRDRFLFLKFENYAANRLQVVREAASFIGLNPHDVVPEEKVINTRGSHLRAHSPLLKRVIFSDRVMRKIVPKTPRIIKSLAKTALTRKMPDVQPELSAETLRFVEDRLGDVGQCLDAMGVHGFQWPLPAHPDNSDHDSSS
ncbi:MAG: sulfotransferase domain-containing protein [Pseudomonadota bacterium]